MADRKISDLTALTTPASGDYLPIVDISEASAANKNKRITIEELLRGAPDGTAGAPGIGFESDPNTGIYSPDADALGLVTAGTECLRITSAGLVGIGTTSPQQALHVVNSSNTNTSADNVSFLIESVNRNAIIGIKAKSNVDSILSFSDELGASVGEVRYTHTDDSMRFRVNAAERARIDSSGRLLVGASSTSADCRALFEDNSANNGPSIVYLSSSAATPADGAGLGLLRFSASNHSPTAQIVARRDGGTWTAGSSQPSRLEFSTTADGASSPTEQLRITSDRYVRLASGTGGIQFNGDTAAANALDDYEEGTFTPVISGGTTAGTGTYVNQHGEYVKTGRSVSINIRLEWTAHTGTGIFRIFGLPFAASNRNSGSNLYGLAVYSSYVDFGTGATAPLAFVSGNSAIIDLRGFVNDAIRESGSINSDASGSVLTLTGTYQV